jgi:hypothetical protein
MTWETPKLAILNKPVAKGITCASGSGLGPGGCIDNGTDASGYPCSAGTGPGS